MSDKGSNTCPNWKGTSMALEGEFLLAHGTRSERVQQGSCETILGIGGIQWALGTLLCSCLRPGPLGTDVRCDAHLRASVCQQAASIDSTWEQGETWASRKQAPMRRATEDERVSQRETTRLERLSRSARTDERGSERVKWRLDTRATRACSRGSCTRGEECGGGKPSCAVERL